LTIDQHPKNKKKRGGGLGDDRKRKRGYLRNRKGKGRNGKKMRQFRTCWAFIHK